VAETYYKIDLNIEVKESQIKFDTVHVSFQVQLVVVVVLWPQWCSGSVGLELLVDVKGFQ
jgi:hypothetical protein